MEEEITKRRFIPSGPDYTDVVTGERGFHFENISKMECQIWRSKHTSYEKGPKGNGIYKHHPEGWIDYPIKEVNENAIEKLDGCGLPLERKSGKFRLANQKILLTYAGHLEKAVIKEWLNSECKGCTTIEIAHETGTSKGVDYKHTHVLIDFGRNFQTTNARKFDYNEIHPNIRIIKSKTHWNNCMNYLAKEDPENAHLAKKFTVVENVWACENKSEAITNFVKKPQDVIGISLLYDLKPKPEIIPIKPNPWNPWLDSLERIVEGPPDHYQVIWIFDHIGRQGKTTYCQWKEDCDPSRFCSLQGSMSNYHLATCIDTIMTTNGWNGHCMFVNLVRSNEDSKSLYATLESLKDGRLVALKYKGGKVRWGRCHVVVMANFLPDCDKLSEERWDIKMLWNKELMSITTTYARALKKDSWYENNVGARIKSDDTFNSLLTFE